MLYLPLILNLIQILICTAEEVDDDLMDPDFYERHTIIGDIAVPLSGRNSATDKSSWSRGIIPYKFERHVNQFSKNVLLFIMGRYNAHTGGCIKFVERTTQPDYILIVVGGSGCYSSVGRDGGKQVVHLAVGCVKRGAVTHELLHALGFYHEHSRTDRDHYVAIQTQNILHDKLDQFGIEYSSITHGVPYDYLSIVHYGGFDFTKNRRATIVTLDSRYQYRIGRSYDLSARDIQKIKKRYKCVPIRSVG